MKKLSALTFGSCGWDRIFTVDKSGTEKLIYEEEGRKNSHQAVAIKRASGGKSTLVSFVGDDEIGKKVFASLKNCGINTQYIKTIEGASTEVNHQYLDETTKDYKLKRFPSPLSQNYTPAMVGEYKDEILKSDIVILVSKQPKDFLTAVIDFCFNNKIKTALTVSHEKFDINNDADLNTLKKVTFIAGNLSEGQALTGLTSPFEMLMLLPNLIITSSKGVWFCDESGKHCFEKSVPAKNIVETNGAGDTFLGNFLAWDYEGNSKTECVKFGMCASTLEIQKMGVLNAMPFREDTLALYKAHYKILKPLH